EVKMLDMAPDAVDDDFLECRDKMLKVVTDSLLQEELDSEEEFKDLWSKYSGTCRKSIPGGTSLHTDALQAYGNSKLKFRTNFNNLVYSNGTNNTTYRDFRFKSLHFLLSDSLRLLNPTNTCRTVYYGTNKKYTVVLGTKVRFGMFLNPTTSKSAASEDVDSEEGSLFIINSCSVVDVEQKPCNCEELQYLLSPAEVFT
ncbi:T-cell ecto-ADP-ribosyltransferase 1-like, partial [Tachysurus ichikawai]